MPETAPNVVEMPVCYGGEYGPDLAYVAEYCHLTEEEVVKIHSSGEYLCCMIGFCPGFPFLGGMDPRIATPRRQTPRLAIPAQYRHSRTANWRLSNQYTWWLADYRQELVKCLMPPRKIQPC